MKSLFFPSKNTMDLHRALALYLPDLWGVGGVRGWRSGVESVLFNVKWNTVKSKKCISPSDPRSQFIF